jgi:cytochrome c oxidase subunit II
MGTTLLAIAAVTLFFVVVFFIAKASELSSEVKGDADDYTQASKVNGVLLLVFLVLGMIGVIYTGIALIPRMLPDSASIHGDEIDKMFNITTLISFFVFVVTHILLLGFAFKYRYKKGRQVYFFPHDNKLEMIWTIVPAVVLTFLVFKGIKTWNEIFDFKSLEQVENPLVFEATAKQFGWILRYPGPDGELGDRKITKENVSGLNELGVDFDDPRSHDDIYASKIMLVKGRPTLVKLGALDVLHGFFLPHFRVKMDCVPGLPTQFMFTPKYTTQEYREILSKKKYWQQLNEDGIPRWQAFNFELACTELCGKSHYAMQKFVEVVTQEEYDQWVSEQTSYYKTVINPQAATAKPVEVEVTETEEVADEELAEVL